MGHPHAYSLKPSTVSIMNNRYSSLHQLDYGRCGYLHPTIKRELRDLSELHFTQLAISGKDLQAVFFLPYSIALAGYVYRYCVIPRGKQPSHASCGGLLVMIF